MLVKQANWAQSKYLGNRFPLNAKRCRGIAADDVSSFEGSRESCPGTSTFSSDSSQTKSVGTCLMRFRSCMKSAMPRRST